MSVNLSEPDRDPLSRAPVGLVACQVSFSDMERRLASKEVFRYRDTLNRGLGGYGELSPIQRNQVMVQIGGPLGAATSSETSSSKGWRLATRDNAWSVALFADSVLLESRAYQSWNESFRPRLADAISGAIESFKPEVETRVGLRYINALSDKAATSPLYWSDKVQPAFLGALGHEGLGSFFTGSTSRGTFRFDEIHASVTLAFQPDAVYPDCTAVVFDLDIYHQGAREFALETLMDVADLLNTRALQVFQSIVTCSYLSELR